MGKKRIFKNWEVICLIGCFTLLTIIVLINFQIEPISQGFNSLLNTITGLLCSAIAAILLLALQRWHEANAQKNYYKAFAGDYTRKDISLDGKLGEDLNRVLNIKAQNIGEPMKMTYMGDNFFKIEASYWKNREGKINAIIEFNESNKNIAYGRYDYIQGNGLENHFGNYIVDRLKGEKIILLILFQHVFPREKANFVDDNRGWELWEKV